MAIRRSPLDPYPVTPKFLQTRNSALHIPATQFKGFKIKTDEVYGIVIDVPMGPEILLTMVCFINGAANLYFNNGAQIKGLAANHPALAQSCRSFLASAGQSLPACERTSVFDLPTNPSEHYVHLMTRKGVYKTVVNPMTAGSEADKMRAFLLHLYQKVMNEIQTAQAKEAAARK